MDYTIILSIILHLNIFPIESMTFDFSFVTTYGIVFFKHRGIRTWLNWGCNTMLWTLLSKLNYVRTLQILFSSNLRARVLSWSNRQSLLLTRTSSSGYDSTSIFSFICRLNIYILFFPCFSFGDLHFYNVSKKTVLRIRCPKIRPLRFSIAFSSLSFPALFPIDLFVSNGFPPYYSSTTSQIPLRTLCLFALLSVSQKLYKLSIWRDNLLQFTNCNDMDCIKNI